MTGTARERNIHDNQSITTMTGQQITTEDPFRIEDIFERIIQKAIAPELSRQLSALRTETFEKLEESARRQNPRYYTRDEVCEQLHISRANYPGSTRDTSMKPGPGTVCMSRRVL